VNQSKRLAQFWSVNDFRRVPQQRPPIFANRSGLDGLRFTSNAKAQRLYEFGAIKGDQRKTMDTWSPPRRHRAKRPGLDGLLFASRANTQLFYAFFSLSGNKNEGEGA
jgi:hypothetical protein